MLSRIDPQHPGIVDEDICKQQAQFTVEEMEVSGRRSSWILHLFFFFACISGAQGLYLDAHLGITFVGFRERYEMPGIEPGLPACKASALPTVLSLQPQIVCPVNKHTGALDLLLLRNFVDSSRLLEKEGFHSFSQHVLVCLQVTFRCKSFCPVLGGLCLQLAGGPYSAGAGAWLPECIAFSSLNDFPAQVDSF